MSKYLDLKWWSYEPLIPNTIDKCRLNNDDNCEEVTHEFVNLRFISLLFCVTLEQNIISQ